MVRNAAALVWDTLYGVDRALKSQRQMIDVEEVSAQGRTWTFRLPANLKFHDGEPARAKDCRACDDGWKRPPRTTRRPQFSVVQIEPSAGAPL